MEGRKQSEFGHRKQSTYLFVELDVSWFKQLLNVLAKMVRVLGMRERHALRGFC